LTTRGHQRPDLERFTIRARAVLQAAARARHGAEVDARDLLAGLFTVPEGLAAQVLAAMGVTAASVQAARPQPPRPAPPRPA
jgi:Clp amino terminal domain, pathogenicity island component